MSKPNCSFVPSIHHSNVVPLTPARSVRYPISTWVVVAALVGLATAAGIKPELAGSQSSVILRAAENPPASTEFVYFPGQYVNQATEAAEHIQAF